MAATHKALAQAELKIRQKLKKSSGIKANTKVHEEKLTPWKRGSSLDTPPAKTGFDQRWIRFMVGGEYDATNYSRKVREGWTPVDKDAVPENWQMMHSTSGRITGIIVEGLILCERPRAVSKRRLKAMQIETARRTEASDHDLESVNKSNRNPAFGEIEKQTRSTPAREVTIQND